jgi:hypothetical protein
VPSLKGRRFFFATAADLRPGLASAQKSIPSEFVLHEMRDDASLTVYQSLADAPDFGLSERGSVSGSPQYFVFRRGSVPKPRAIPQERGGTKYAVDPTPDCLILRCGGLHEPTAALVAGELQQPLEPSRQAVEMFDVYASELLRSFKKVGLYWLGPEALEGFRGAQRLVTIGVRSPREYDLAEV